MKRISFFALVLCSCSSTPRAVFMDRGLYNNSPFVSGTAATPEEAKARALAAIPAGFELDQELPQPVLSCGKPGEAPEWSEARKSLSQCASGTYRVDFALLPKEGMEREAILRTRQAGLAALEQQDEQPKAQ